MHFEYSQRGGRGGKAITITYQKKRGRAAGGM